MDVTELADTEAVQGTDVNPGGILRLDAILQHQRGAIDTLENDGNTLGEDNASWL